MNIHEHVGGMNEKGKSPITNEMSLDMAQPVIGQEMPMEIDTLEQVENHIASQRLMQPNVH
ncbi:hypothetical protein [Dictyobacter arantiisoli]|uniref:Uncharacterized protein n=1 Tax=Dictyobacter arantiisoli TaxID=2014874 RepID=A0A5A5TAV3_9CHLR|nr:hypothetical protein [Dictyobacter arantiisoli]GCF08119.1 hypothetical protein KDI_16830 [Dictyobacter arantiisoli]